MQAVGYVVHYGFPYYARAHYTFCTYYARALYKNSDKYPIPTGSPIRVCKDCQPNMTALLESAGEIVWGGWGEDAMEKVNGRLSMSEGDMVEDIVARRIRGGNGGSDNGVL